MLQRVRNTYHRIEVRSRYAAEGKNQRNQNGSRCNGIGKQGESYIAPCERLTHDSGSDHSGNQQGCPYEFRSNFSVSRDVFHTIPFLNSSSGYFVPRHTIPSCHKVRIIERSSV